MRYVLADYGQVTKGTGKYKPPFLRKDDPTNTVWVVKAPGVHESLEEPWCQDIEMRPGSCYQVWMLRELSAILRVLFSFKNHWLRYLRQGVMLQGPCNRAPSMCGLVQHLREVDLQVSHALFLIGEGMYSIRLGSGRHRKTTTTTNTCIIDIVIIIIMIGWPIW